MIGKYISSPLHYNPSIVLMASVRQQSYTGEKKHFYLKSLSIKLFEHISIMSVFISLAQSVMKMLLITLICATTGFYKTSVLTLEDWTTASRSNLTLVKLHWFTPDEDLSKKAQLNVFFAIVKYCNILSILPTMSPLWDTTQVDETCLFPIPAMCVDTFSSK